MGEGVGGSGVPGEVDVVARCRAVVDAMAAGAPEPMSVAAFAADLATLPAGHPERGALAATMIVLLTNGGGHPRLSVLGELGPLLDMVRTAPAHLLAWPEARDSARAFQLVHEAQEQVIPVPAATAELDELAARHPGVTPTSAAIRTAQMSARLVTAGKRGDESTQRELVATFERLADHLGDVPRSGTLRDMGKAMQELFEAQRTQDWGAVVAVMDRMRDGAAAMGLDPATFTLPPGAKAMLDMSSDEPPTHTELTTDEVVAQYAVPGSGAAGKLTASYVLMGGGGGTDLDRIDRAIELTRQAASEPGPMQLIARSGIALNLYRKAEVLGTTEGLDEARAVLEDLVDDLRGLGGSAHPMWTDVHHQLALVKRRSGDEHGSGADELSGLFRFAHRALLESDPAVARDGLREAAHMGMELARARVRFADYAGAMDALDIGRGLMLFAEVEVLDLGAKLRAVGRADLADRWEAAGARVPGLRAEAIEVLVNAAGGIDGLLKRPSQADVRAALTTVDADALVYLVPAQEQQPGMALVVPREGPMAHLPLTFLSLHAEAGVERYLTALSRLSRELKPAAGEPFKDQLDELCEWAWRVAIGPLLERYFARDSARRGRVPRIVLIPMAGLAAIPWHAARNSEGTYAVELAAFSHAVSAREFCANAARPPVRLTSTGLVVGDPHTAGPAKDLPAARLEAYEVHRAFLRAAKYVGRRPNGTVSRSGPGTAEQVRSWLTAEAAHAGTVLHLACHGQFSSDERAAKACLLLAPGGPGESGELGADEIVSLLHSTPDRQVGLVVMAACHTGRSIHGYDEAYSLGTAFLAGGVRTVLSTQWAVPDEATSMLMYLFHHYLRTERVPPWQALRSAQLHMLRPETPVPDTMPAHLRELADGRELVSGGEHTGVVGWAGFVHGGH
ncbi:CHAT domain-containing protein [Actinokineospora globicatena]|uniref:CHAT domain-containing protein n=1 Tax=Actinokineospora globicatena TaxID=103729 RepID=UPI0020A59DDB|nr:CHAT domain-containing protein [Actinokineospora globicatena]MCP2302880.1 CHAT domain-containing protein [Actinokineospora globicatena]GLW78737.1 hypothetical protein Aglo01_32190 [Actinokineospora globicatena]GLW84595.1 hypothetical protein Aglo02_22350 [Actinokineospora globicatena]